MSDNSSGMSAIVAVIAVIAVVAVAFFAVQMMNGEKKGTPAVQVDLGGQTTSR